MTPVKGETMPSPKLTCDIPEPADGWVDWLRLLAENVENHGEHVGLHGAANELERVRGELDRLHGWDGLLQLLDEHWPEDVFPRGDPKDESRDTETRLLAAIRWIDELRDCKQLLQDLGRDLCGCDHVETQHERQYQADHIVEVFDDLRRANENLRRLLGERSGAEA